MSPPSPSFARVWLAVLALMVGFAAWSDARRLQRIEHVARLTRGESLPDAASPTGYAGGVRERVLPDHDGRGYEWIAQTQRWLAGDDWDPHHIVAENAPFGRASHAPSPYRWWLGAIARLNQGLAGNAPGIAVDRAALYADPLLHILLLIALTLFARRWLGPAAAIAAAIAGALLFPFAARFLPGAPDDAVLEAWGALGGLLPLLAGWRALDETAAPGRRSALYWFALAGFFGGLGFWFNPAAQAPVAGGILAGAALAGWLRRPAPAAAPWRTWALSGGATVLLASLIEFYPDHLAGWELRAVHPLYGLAWIGAGELLARADGWWRDRRMSWQPRDLAAKLAALLAVLALPLAMWRTGNPGFLALDSLFFRLTNQPGGVMAPNAGEWLRAGGSTPAAWSAFLPLLLLGPAVWLVTRRATDPARRSALALALGPVALLLPVACFQLRRWLLLDTALLVVLVATADALGDTRPLRRRAWFAGMILLLLPGAFQLLPPRSAATDNVLTVPEAVGVVERDLAHWLAKRGRAGAPSIVLAPPALTASLAYYGGLRGLGTLSWENQEGLAFALRVVISTSRNENAALLRQRNVTYIVVPSWDGFFDVYVQGASVQNSELFYQGLIRWNLPPWLRPVPYRMPSLPGLENQSVRVFEVVDDQDAPVAASRLTEYFIAMDRLDLAKASYPALLKYPADFGALVARAQFWMAVRDRDNFTAAFESLLERLAGGGDRYLPWDRRVNLAIVLAQGDRPDLARTQAQRCLAELNENRLRSLSSDALYRLLALNKALGLEIADPALRELARTLLPEQLRSDPALQ